MLEPTSNYARFRQRYLDGTVPWDDANPPPEVIDLVSSIPPGVGLDLGCGYGRTGIYLALHGWTADGVDYVPEAIEVARVRASEAHVEDKTRFFVSSVTDMPFLTPAYDLAIDIGCLHSFAEPDRRAYYSELLRLIASDGWYLVFARLQDENETEESSPARISEEIIFDLFAPEFDLIRFERGISKMPDQPPWASGWFWFKRR